MSVAVNNKASSVLYIKFAVCFFPNLTRFEVPSIKEDYHDPASRSRGGACGQTDGHEEVNMPSSRLDKSA